MNRNIFRKDRECETAPSQETLLQIIEAQMQITKCANNLNQAMDVATKTIQKLTHAEGATIEMVEGDRMVYRATSGSLESFLGFSVPVDGSLSGTCVKEGKLLYTKDTHTDDRVDREACIKVNARSMIVMPLRYKEEDVGVLKLISKEEDFFGKEAICILALISEMLSITMYNAIAMTSETNELENVKQRINELIDQNSSLYIAKDLAEAKMEAKGVFLANMSHEIRTPMNAILGFVDRLIKEDLTPKQMQMLQIVKSSGKSLLSIINDILDFSKIESGKISIESHNCNFVNLANEVHTLFQESCYAKQIVFRNEFSSEIPQCIVSDEIRLKQVISNLTSNAVKFTPEGGEILLSSEYDSKNETITCSVSDNGTGIAQENLEKIFTAFEQEHDSTARKFGGTGLGLSISSKIIALLGGTLQVESTLGEGSRFYFTIPVKPCAETDFKDFKEHVELSHNIELRGKILVVEDNKVNQLLIQSILEDYDITFEIANDGVEAVKVFKDHCYDLILMDENMPNMNGVVATQVIRRYEAEHSLEKTPIIAVSANAFSEDKARFKNAGMDDCITKPYTERDVVLKLQQYLR